jgi:hypothetical protein
MTGLREARPPLHLAVRVEAARAPLVAPQVARVRGRALRELGVHHRRRQADAEPQLVDAQQAVDLVARAREHRRAPREAAPVGGEVGDRQFVAAQDQALAERQREPGRRHAVGVLADLEAPVRVGVHDLEHDALQLESARVDRGVLPVVGAVAHVDPRAADLHDAALAFDRLGADLDALAPARDRLARAADRDRLLDWVVEPQRRVLGRERRLGLDRLALERDLVGAREGGGEDQEDEVPHALENAARGPVVQVRRAISSWNRGTARSGARSGSLSNHALCVNPNSTALSSASIASSVRPWRV